MDFIKILRPFNLFIMAFVLVIIRYFLFVHFYAEAGIYLQQSLLSFNLMLIATVMIGAGGNLINDLVDVNIDHVNNPDKITIDKIMPRQIILRVYSIITAFGVSTGVVSALVDGVWYLGFIFPIIAYILFNYSMIYKKLPFIGNFVVALLCSFVPLMIWLFEFLAGVNAGAYVPASFESIKVLFYFIVCFSIFAFITTLIREMLKDIEDIKGDAVYGLKTLPIMLGVGKVKWIIFFISFVLFVALFCSGYLLYINNYSGLSIILFVLSVFTIAFTFFIYYAKYTKDFGRLSLIIKLIMICGILSLIFV